MPDGRPDHPEPAEEAAACGAEVKVRAEAVQAEQKGLLTMFGPSGSAKEVMNWTGAIIALGLLCLLAFLVWALVFVQVPAGNKDAMLIVIGVVSNAIAGIVGWFFGTSYGSQKKTEAIEKLTRGP